MKAFAHPDYMEQMLQFADIEYLRSLAGQQKKYSIRFLCDSDDGYKWCEYDLIRLDEEDVPERVAVAYTNIDEPEKDTESETCSRYTFSTGSCLT